MHAEIKKRENTYLRNDERFQRERERGSRFFFFLGMLLYPSGGLVVECPALLSPLLMSRKVYGLLA